MRVGVMMAGLLKKLLQTKQNVDSLSEKEIVHGEDTTVATQGRKAPVKSGDNPRRASFLARMGNAKGPEYKDGKPTRLLLSLRAWGASSKADARAKAKAISKRNKAKSSKKKVG